jgi:hypothetical protein
MTLTCKPSFYGLTSLPSIAIISGSVITSQCTTQAAHTRAHTHTLTNSHTLALTHTYAKTLSHTHAHTRKRTRTHIRTLQNLDLTKQLSSVAVSSQVQKANMISLGIRLLQLACETAWPSTARALLMVRLFSINKNCVTTVSLLYKFDLLPTALQHETKWGL